VRRGITADTAVRLARCLGITPSFRLNLQRRCDPQVARAAVGDRRKQEVQVLIRDPGG
jgi:plasmid maintenance system antidote protein VapI